MAVPVDYGTTTGYFTDMGLIGLPVGGVVGSAACLAQMYAPICYKVITFIGEVFGDQPILPNPDTNSDNEILLYKAISGAMPNPLPDQSQSWTIQIQYIYLLLNPPADYEGIGLGVNPYGINPAPANAQLLPQILWSPIIPATPANPPPFTGFPFSAPGLAGILNQGNIGGIGGGP